MQKVNNRKPDNAAQKTVDGMERRIPKRVIKIIFSDFTQNLSGKDENHDDDLQRVGKIDLRMTRHHRRNQKHDKRDKTEKNVIIVFVKELRNSNNKNADNKKKIDKKENFVFLKNFPPLLKKSFHFSFHTILYNFNTFPFAGKETPNKNDRAANPIDIHRVPNSGNAEICVFVKEKTKPDAKQKH